MKKYLTRLLVSTTVLTLWNMVDVIISVAMKKPKTWLFKFDCEPGVIALSIFGFILMVMILIIYDSKTKV